MVLDVISAVLVVAGCAFYGAGTVGLLRFPDLNNRLHALVKADNLGLGLLLAGLALQANLPVAVKLVLIWLLALLAAATSSFLLADRPPAGPAGQPELPTQEAAAPRPDRALDEHSPEEPEGARDG